MKFITTIQKTYKRVESVVNPDNFTGSKKRIWDLLFDFSCRMGEHKVFLLAAGIAFNIMLCILPLILIALFLAKFFIPSDVDLYVLIIDVLRSLTITVGDTDKIIGGIVKVVQDAATTSPIVGIVGFAILVWVSSAVISSLNTCISMIFNIEQPHYFKTKLKDLGMTILLDVLILLYGFVVPIFSIGIGYLTPIFPDFFAGFISQTIITISQAGIAAALFFFIYWFVPSRKTRGTTRKREHHWVATLATIMSVVAITLAKILFTWYITYLANYSRFYGTLAIVAILVVWLYYSCFIILFSAEVANFIWDKWKAPKKIEL